MQTRLDLLPPGSPLRQMPLGEIRATYKWIHSKGNPRPVLPSFAISHQCFDNLCGARVDFYEWYCEVG